MINRIALKIAKQYFANTQTLWFELPEGLVNQIWMKYNLQKENDSCLLEISMKQYLEKYKQQNIYQENAPSNLHLTIKVFFVNRNLQELNSCPSITKWFNSLTANQQQKLIEFTNANQMNGVMLKGENLIFVCSKNENSARTINSIKQTLVHELSDFLIDLYKIQRINKSEHVFLQNEWEDTYILPPSILQSWKFMTKQFLEETDSHARDFVAYIKSISEEKNISITLIIKAFKDFADNNFKSKLVNIFLKSQENCKNDVELFTYLSFITIIKKIDSSIFQQIIQKVQKLQS